VEEQRLARGGHGARVASKIAANYNFKVVSATSDRDRSTWREGSCSTRGGHRSPGMASTTHQSVDRETDLTSFDVKRELNGWVRTFFWAAWNPGIRKVSIIFDEIGP
jgi:hypothetical protein